MSDELSVQKTAEGIGLGGIVLGIMAVFGAATLLIVFSFHSVLAGIYALSEWTGIPFLALLAWPIWVGLPVGLAVDAMQKLRCKYVA